MIRKALSDEIRNIVRDEIRQSGLRAGPTDTPANLPHSSGTKIALYISRGKDNDADAVIEFDNWYEFDNWHDATVELWALRLQNRPEHGCARAEGVMEPATNYHMTRDALPDALKDDVLARVAQLNQEDLQACLTCALDEAYDELSCHPGDPVWFMSQMLEITREWAAGVIKEHQEALKEPTP